MPTLLHCSWSCCYLLICVRVSAGDAIAISTPSLKVKQRVKSAHMVFVTAAAVAPDGSALLTVRLDVSGTVPALVVNESTQTFRNPMQTVLCCGMRNLITQGAPTAGKVAISKIDDLTPHTTVSGRYQPMPARGVRPSDRRRAASCREAPSWLCSSFSWPCSSIMR